MTDSYENLNETLQQCVHVKSSVVRIFVQQKKIKIVTLRHDFQALHKCAFICHLDCPQLVICHSSDSMQTKNLECIQSSNWMISGCSRFKERHLKFINRPLNYDQYVLLYQSVCSKFITKFVVCSTEHICSVGLFQSLHPYGNILM